MARKTSKSETPAKAHVGFSCTPEFARWLDEFASANRRDRSSVIDLALFELARAQGVGLPPQRMPRYREDDGGASFEGRSMAWKKSDGVSNIPIRVHPDVAHLAKVVASFRGIGYPELVSGILRPILKQMEQDELKKLEERLAGGKDDVESSPSEG